METPTYISQTANLQGSKKGFIKGEAFRPILQTNSSETAFKAAISQFQTNLIERGYSETLVSTTLKEITFEERKPALPQRGKQNTQILPFSHYRPSVPNEELAFASISPMLM